MTQAQIAALIALDEALGKVTELGLLDILAADVHPDYINTFCDEVRRMTDMVRT